jgi:hypothetical protein
MKWRDIEIKDMIDQQLIDAGFELADMQAKREAKLTKVKPRHANFKLEINPAFLQLQTEVNNEIDRRGLI